MRTTLIYKNSNIWRYASEGQTVEGRATMVECAAGSSQDGGL